ncbi:MAG TPA: leucyl/phenylalanyl-tRNA--protein transferase [Gammaproteobacteria bacterium]|nr:leucyl/phenylalanyl-tRNA--protein transferase [Gammaproteobacteria bacterium]
MRPELIAGAPQDWFPPDTAALAEPNGLLAVGGDLSAARLLAAYRRGIFPWYEEGQPILWWTPEPRCVLDPRELRVSHRLRRTLRQARFTVSWNGDFGGVIRGCAAPRASGEGTWITPAMIAAYERLHRLGHAHSIEIHRGGHLVGGLYGIALGAAFFAESMFSRERDASKFALVALCARFAGIRESLIDCQIPSPHVIGLGAKLLPRSEFLRDLARAIAAAGPFDLPSGPSLGKI